MNCYITAQNQILLDYWHTHQHLPPGKLPITANDRISDITGITIGHSTLASNEQQTGITALIPATHNLYTHPLPCGVSIINGYGKSTGLLQIEELGQLETPILLTNTFSVGTVATGLIQYMLGTNPEIGRQQPTVNPIVLECNDGHLNNIQALALNETHVNTALKNTSIEFTRGSIGAGRGMSCFELKGGIGTAAREIGVYKLGALVLANYGTLEQLTLCGAPFGIALKPYIPEAKNHQDTGSIIIILATDAPLDARQLKRLAKRTAAGLARTGSHYGHGSGDIALAFSTQTTPAVPNDHDLNP